MKPVKRLVYSPTRSPRLNEMLGLIVLVTAGLLLLALLTYTPSDPSFNTVGGAAGLHPAHNWTGIAGAYLSDLLLQTLGVAVFFVPLLLVRIGISWMRSRSIGSLTGKSIGLGLWLIFAPAAIALFPGHMRWRSAVPLSGLIGSTLADGLIHIVNFPGAVIVGTLMVAVSLYLTTSFMLGTAQEWFSSHFAFASNLRNRWINWRAKRKELEADSLIDAYESKRERAIAKARKRAERAETDAEPAHPSTAAHENGSLLSGFFGWFSRRKQTADPAPELHSDRATFNAEPPSVWESMPRTIVAPAEAPIPAPSSRRRTKSPCLSSKLRPPRPTTTGSTLPAASRPHQAILPGIDIPEAAARAHVRAQAIAAPRASAHAVSDGRHSRSEHRLRQTCRR